MGGALQCVEFLIGKFADVNQRGQYGRTPLWRAGMAMSKGTSSPKSNCLSNSLNPFLVGFNDLGVVLENFKVGQEKQKNPLFLMQFQAILFNLMPFRLCRYRICEIFGQNLPIRHFTPHFFDDFLVFYLSFF